MADEPWLTRDYRSWWRLPEPLPSVRWPRWLLGLLTSEIVMAVLAGM